MVSLPHILLVSGSAASGKSTYSRWLKDNKGWYHCEGDQVFTDQESVEAAVQEAQARTQRTVIDWGFPPACLNKVRWVTTQGVEIWWFDGDREAAKTSFTKRGQSGQHPATMQALKIQLAAIEASWSQIGKVFGAHIIRSVEDGPQYLGPDRIFEAMFGPR